MYESTQEGIITGATIFLCVCAIVFGGAKGCKMEADHNLVIHGQTTAAVVECLKQGYAPLDCTNALGK